MTWDQQRPMAVQARTRYSSFVDFCPFFSSTTAPATFTYLFYSYLGDWMMWKDVLTGKIRF
jgi:hypothetical protein